MPHNLTNLPFENKVALVTGAGSGMGLATAKAFAEAGASVVLADRDGESVRVAAGRLVAEGHKALAIRCDVAVEEQVAAMVEQAVATFGRLDAAFNNAGVQSPVAETADASGEEFDLVNSVNLRGVWNCMKYELLQMRQQGSGAIVNNSSIGGLVGIAGRGSLSRRQARGDRADQERLARVCLAGHHDQRRLPGDHRDTDGRGDAGHPARGHERADEGGADRAAWPGGRGRLRRPLAL